MLKARQIKKQTNFIKLTTYAIKARHNDFRKSQQQHVDLLNQLCQSTTLLKSHCILFFVIRLQSMQTHLIELRHQKKHDNLIIEKRLCDCTQGNKNKIITNVTNITLTQDGISVLEFGLKNGVLLKPKEPHMTGIVENVWEQIEKRNILKDHIVKVRAQTVLKLFTYICLNLDIKQYFSDNKMIKALRNIKEKFLILNRKKGQRIVLTDTTDYYNSMEH